MNKHYNKSLKHMKLTHNILRIVIIIVSIFSTSCVYYNTFYHAEQAFEKARKSQIKRSKKITADTIALLIPSEKTLFKRAIKKSFKVINVYPHKKKWADDAIFLIGKSYFYSAEYSKAIRKFKELNTLYKDSPFIPESNLLLAKSYMKNGDFKEALKAFKIFKEKYPKHKETMNIPIYTAEIEASLGSKLSAINQLKKALDQANPRQASQIYLKIARLDFANKNYNKAYKEYSACELKFFSKKEIYECNIRKAQCLRNMSKYTEALIILKKLSNNEHYQERLAEILTEQGQIYEALGKYEKALALYKKAISTPNIDSNVFATAAFLAGNIYQKNKGDFKKAKIYYDKIPQNNFKKTKEKKKAKARSESITAIENLVKSLTDSSSNPDTSKHLCLTKYKIGELFWFNLDEADSALTWLNNSIKDTACNKNKSRVLYFVSHILLEGFNDTLKSDSILNLIIKQYPSSIYAKKAQKDLGFPITIKTRKDSCLESYLKAENKLWNKKDYKNAAIAFDSIATKFKDIELAPKAAYTSAWIYNELLNDSAKAYSKYKDIYKKWGKSKYANMAKKKILAVIDSDN